MIVAAVFIAIAVVSFLILYILHPALSRYSQKSRKWKILISLLFGGGIILLFILFRYEKAEYGLWDIKRDRITGAMYIKRSIYHIYDPAYKDIYGLHKEIADSEFASLSDEEKRKMANAYFDSHIASDPRYPKLTEDQQRKIRDTFLARNVLGEWIHLSFIENISQALDWIKRVEQRESEILLEERRRITASSPRQNRAPGWHVGSSDCDSGHWVDSVSNDGQIVILEDGSIWEVDPVDAIDSMLWLPTTDIIACDDKLINTDDNEIVSAQEIR